MHQEPQAGFRIEDLKKVSHLTEDAFLENAHIELSGFGEVNASEKEAADRIIGNYVKRLSDRCEKLEKLHVTIKGVHTGTTQKKVEVHGKLIDNGRSYTSEVVDHDVLVCLDKALQKLENAVAR